MKSAILLEESIWKNADGFLKDASKSKGVNMKQYVIFLYDNMDELIDNPIVEGRNECDAFMKFKQSEEGQNSNFKWYSIREWKGCYIDNEKRV
jgi:hypothetical protein